MTSPLDQLVARLNAFLPGGDHHPSESPSAMVLSVRVAPEHVELATRVVARMEDDERGFAMLPYPAEDESTPEAYFGAWARAVDERFEELEREVARVHELGDVPSELALVVPARAPLATRDAPEAAFVAWIERLAQRSVRFVRSLVLVTYVDDDVPPAITASLRRLAGLLASPRVRLIVLDARSEPLLSDARTSPSRVTVGSLLSLEQDAPARFRDFVRSDQHRVLVATGASNAPAMLGLLPAGAGFFASAPYRGRAKFEAALAESLRGWLRDPGAWQLAGDEDMWASLEELSGELERLATQSGVDTLLVAIDAAPSITPQFLAAWVEMLAALLPSSQTKLVLLEDVDQPVRAHLQGAPAHFPRGFESTSFGFDASALREMAHASASDPDRPARERFASLLSLAGYASGEGQIDEALALVARAAPLATSADDRAHVAYVRGATLYRGERFELATQAFEAGLSDLSEQPVSTTWVAQLTAGLANTGFRLAVYAEAAELYQAAADLFNQAGQPLVAAEIQGWHAESWARAGQQQRAEQVLAQAIESLPDGLELEQAAAAQRAQLMERRARLREHAGDAQGAAALREAIRRAGIEVHLCEHP